MLAARSFVGSWSLPGLRRGRTDHHAHQQETEQQLSHCLHLYYAYGPYVKRYVLLFGLVRAATRYHLYVTPPTWRVDVISPNDEIEPRRAGFEPLQSEERTWAPRRTATRTSPTRCS